MISRFLLSVTLTGAFAAVSIAQFPGGGGRGGDRGATGGGRGGGGGDRGSMGGGRGGGGMDPDMIWNMMSQGKDSINLNDPANARTRDRMMQQGQAIPPNGILTKNDFRVAFEQRMASGGGRGGRGGPGAPGGMVSGTQTMTMTPGPNGQMMMSTNGGPPMPVTGNPSIMGGPGGDRGGRGGGGGFDPTGMTDDQVKQMMASRYELDPAGRISFAAAQNSSRGGGIKDSFTQYDMNRDGFVDVNEYRGYLMSRMNGGGMSGGMNNGMNNFQPGMTGPQGWGAAGGMPGGMPDRGRKTDDEDPKPVVYRYGNMPKEVPSWFEQQDTDKDGQIGLYEWRAAKKSLAEFEEYDLNGDGFVTAEEWLRKQRTDLAKREEEERMSKPAGTATAGTGRSSFGSFPGGGRSGPGGGAAGSGDRTAPGGGRNPFTGAGGPPAGGGRGGPGGGGPGGPGGGGRGGRGGGNGGGTGETSDVQNAKDVKKDRAKGGSKEE